MIYPWARDRADLDLDNLFEAVRESQHPQVREALDRLIKVARQHHGPDIDLLTDIDVRHGFASSDIIASQ